MTNETRPIRILVADDYPVIRRGLVTIFASHPMLTVVAEAGDASEVLAAMERASVDVVVLDLGMPGVRGLELVRELRREYPDLGILVYTMQREEDLALPCLRAGANGFLHKTAPDVELVRAVQAAAEGLRYLSRALTERAVAEMSMPSEAPPHQHLSNRELHVLCMLAEGKRPSEIGRRLGIAAKTVHTYRSRILDKLGVRTTVDLVLYVAEHNLLGWSERNDRILSD